MRRLIKQHHMVNGLDPMSAIQIPGSQSAIETRGDFSLSRYRSPAMPHANIKLAVDEFIPELLQIRPMLAFGAYFASRNNRCNSSMVRSR